MAFTHIDCFSGPGGICTGLHAAGFDTKVAIEYIKSCVDTYSANHPTVHVIHSDIRNVTEEQLLPYIPKGGIDLVTSGMPCETFSTAGNTSRSFYDDRQFLFREGIRIARIAKAKMILFENVPAITTKTVAKNSDKLIVDVLKDELRESGYENHQEFILNAADYGVPQKRNRFFILATNDKNLKLSYPKATCNKAVTVKEALCGLPNVVPNSNREKKAYTKARSDYADLMRDKDFWQIGTGTVNEITYHMPMKHRTCTLERFSLLKPGESLKDLFERYVGTEREQLQERHVLPKKMFIKRNYRLKPNEPSPTVTSHCLDEFVHPKYDRALTVRECARLQSFPDAYDFSGGPYLVPHVDREVQDKYEQIGDAVPPLLAYAWGTELNKLLSEYKMKKSTDHIDFYKDIYTKAWDRAYHAECQGKNPQSAKLAAQRNAIDSTLVASLLHYANTVSEDEIWKNISLVHKLHVANLSDFGIPESMQADVLERCLSAQQSWNKSSGHSFERYIARTASDELQENEIRFILQSDLTKMIKEGSLTNTPDDIRGLNSWGKDFDLYAIQSIHGDVHVFGCIQSKTSIRDRVGRDVNFSRNAMDGLFWSAAVTLDGSFLNMDEFKHMVNGGGSYPVNGWHGMYAMAGISESNGRIYKVSDTLDLFIKHAVKAAKQFIADRRMLNASWKAE